MENKIEVRTLIINEHRDLKMTLSKEARCRHYISSVQVTL